MAEMNSHGVPNAETQASQDESGNGSVLEIESHSSKNSFAETQIGYIGQSKDAFMTKEPTRIKEAYKAKDTKTSETVTKSLVLAQAQVSCLMSGPMKQTITEEQSKEKRADGGIPELGLNKGKRPREKLIQQGLTSQGKKAKLEIKSRKGNDGVTDAEVQVAKKSTKLNNFN